MLAFDPDELTQNIQKAQKDLAEAKKTASENKLLEPITDHIKQIESHFKSVATVSEVYDDIYKILLNLFKKKDNLVLNRQ